MKDLRIKDKPKVNIPFKKFNWFSWKMLLKIAIIAIILSLIFNPGGVSYFISNWLCEFSENWKF